MKKAAIAWLTVPGTADPQAVCVSGWTAPCTWSAAPVSSPRPAWPPPAPSTCPSARAGGHGSVILCRPTGRRVEPARGWTEPCTAVAADGHVDGAGGGQAGRGLLTGAADQVQGAVQPETPDGLRIGGTGTVSQAMAAFFMASSTSGCMPLSL